MAMRGLACALMAALCAIFLAADGSACSSEREEVLVCNVLDEMLLCDFADFAKTMGGSYIGDWRRFGDGYGGACVRSVEDGAEVYYQVTTEIGDGGSLDGLVFLKSIDIKGVSGKTLNVEIWQSYSASDKAIECKEPHYRLRNVVEDENVVDGTSSFVSLSEEEAAALMRDNGCRFPVAQMSPDSIEFFAELFMETQDSAYAEWDWGYFSNGKV